MTVESRPSLEKLRAAAIITHALAVQMSELLKLREAVQRAEQAAAVKRPARSQRGDQLFSRSVPWRSDSISLEAAQRKQKLFLADYSCNRSGDEKRSRPLSGGRAVLK